MLPQGEVRKERLLPTFSGSISRSSQSFIVPSMVINGGLELASISPIAHNSSDKDQLLDHTNGTHRNGGMIE